MALAGCAAPPPLGGGVLFEDAELDAALLEFTHEGDDDFLALLRGDDLLGDVWGPQAVPQEEAARPVPSPVPVVAPVDSPSPQHSCSVVLLPAAVSRGPRASRAQSSGSTGNKPALSLPTLQQPGNQWRTVTTTQKQPEAQPAVTSKVAVPEVCCVPPPPSKAARTSGRVTARRGAAQQRQRSPEPTTEDMDEDMSSDDDSNDLELASDEPEEGSRARLGSAATTTTGGTAQTGLGRRPSTGQTGAGNANAGNKRKAPEVDWRSITDPAERRRQRRLAKNRLTAARSRERKKCQWAEMEERLAGCEAQNQALRDALDALGAENARLREQLAAALGGSAAKGADAAGVGGAGLTGAERRVHSEPAALVVLLAILLSLCTLLPPGSLDSPLPALPPSMSALLGSAAPLLLLAGLLLMQRSSASLSSAHASSFEHAEEDVAEPAAAIAADTTQQRAAGDGPEHSTDSSHTTIVDCMTASTSDSTLLQEGWGAECVDAALRVLAGLTSLLSPPPPPPSRSTALSLGGLLPYKGGAQLGLAHMVLG